VSGADAAGKPLLIIGGAGGPEATASGLSAPIPEAVGSQPGRRQTRSRSISPDIGESRPWQPRQRLDPDASSWAKPGAAGLCSTLSIEQATTWRCICTLWKPRRRNPRPRLPLRLAKRRCHRRGSASHITAHRSGSTRVLPLPTGRAGASQVRRRTAPPFQSRSLTSAGSDRQDLPRSRIAAAASHRDRSA
jgi:hypothetical protein